MLTLWSVRNKQLLGTLTNQKNRWAQEDIFKIANELNDAGIQVKANKISTSAQATANNPSTKTTNIRLKNNSTTANNIIMMFWILIGVIVISVFSVIILLDSLLSLDLNNLSFDEAKQAEEGITRQGLLNYLIYGVSLLGSTFFLGWFKQSHKNLHQIGLLDLEYSEHDVRRSFYTPIVALYRPYYIMKEIWLKTQEAIQTMAPNYYIKADTGFISLWWTLFIILEVILIMANMTLTIGGNLIAGLGLHIAFDVCYILAAVALISLVSKISKEEKRLYKVSRRKQPTA